MTGRERSAALAQGTVIDRHVPPADDSKTESAQGLFDGLLRRAGQEQHADGKVAGCKVGRAQPSEVAPEELDGAAGSGFLPRLRSSRLPPWRRDGSGS